MKVTIGGNRLGSGKKMVGRINNYFRSTHNLSEKFASSMQAGILYPCLIKPAMRGDSFDIVMDADARTIPTVGPLFGAFKMQLDIFQVPIRLYQGILHNNPIDIGLNMSQVKFPKLTITTNYDANNVQSGYDLESGKLNNSCLLKYLGLSGLGHNGEDGNGTMHTTGALIRSINAVPMLGYYDIYKTYYANKQEEKAYVISRDSITKKLQIEKVYSITTRHIGGHSPRGNYAQVLEEEIQYNFNEDIYLNLLNTSKDIYIKFNEKYEDALKQQTAEFLETALIYFTNANEDEFYVTLDDVLLQKDKTEDWTYNTIGYYLKWKIVKIDDYTIKITIRIESGQDGITQNIKIGFGGLSQNFKEFKEIAIKQFALKNIDKMREALLCFNELGNVFNIGNGGDWGSTSGADSTGLPYSTLFETKEGETLNKGALNGLALKTYQNDLFNNWLNTDWIEGENGINELTKVTVTDGKFSMDALSFAEKLYNMLNRIAIAGATYEAWQDVVYEQAKRRQIESPIYCGGMSREIMFDEVLQTAPADGKPLGTIGGRGRLIKNTNKGGKVHIKCDEACFIIGIVSLTPRTFYTQGNEFYLTDLQSMDDFHKPAMDGIGFQDLIGERMAWWDTELKHNDDKVMHRSKIGKLPAWIQYMTSVDKAYADFAAEGGAGFMILGRNYEKDVDTGGILDATTYIDPAKYNYAFADAQLTAQNFWLEIAFKITARRLMSARIIPNV